MDGVYAFNIAMLVIGPLSTIGLLAWVMLAAKGTSGKLSLYYSYTCTEVVSGCG